VHAGSWAELIVVAESADPQARGVDLATAGAAPLAAVHGHDVR
jgi:hypothetical protein